MNDITMDNQQRRMEDRLNWLGGIIDGEGMVTLVKKNLRARKQNCYQPKMSVVNTDIVIINEVISIFEAMNIPHFVQSKKDKKFPERKLKYEVIVAGIKRCYNTIPKLLPYLIGKREKAIQLFKFCELRLSKSQNSLYGREEETLLNYVRENKIFFHYAQRLHEGQVNNLMI